MKKKIFKSEQKGDSRMQEISFKIIARIHSDFPEKFGIPRQSGLVQKLRSTIRFENEFQNADALRGLEGFSHLWVMWIFSENIRSTWSPTVRPPRLGGNKRLGVFATRSSFRPNPIALSCVKIEEIKNTENGPEIIVSGADMMDGTPIVDIKPYLPYTDAHPEATGGFAEAVRENKLHVTAAPGILNKLSTEKQSALLEILAEDPRPAYQEDSERIYGFLFADYEIKFKVDGTTLTLLSIEHT